jgi:L-ascorbate metabolism protein UlaG (beta-lactamase superfamily)
MPISITWLGHAALAIQVGGHALIVDPYLTDNPAAARQADEVDAEYILVSHGHGDHVGDAVRIAKRTGATIIANSEVCRWLKERGVEKTHAQQIGGAFQYPFGRVKFTPALHGSSLLDGEYGGLACGFLLADSGGKKIYIAGDTGLFGDMALIGDEGVELAVLPIGGNYTMDPEDALRAVRLLRPASVLPYHYNTWDLIAQDASVWKLQVEAATKTRVIVLRPGESTSVGDD